MCEIKENYMDKIIDVDGALKWFKKDKDFVGKYRAPINGCESFSEDFYKSNINYYKENKKNKDAYYNTKFKKFPYDPDSSARTWEHYIRHYDPSSFGTTKDETPRYLLEGLKYDDNYPKCVTRLYAAPKEYAIKLGTKTKNGCKEATGFLGGDTDFNFNHDKYPRLLKKLLDCSDEEPLKKEKIELLIKCHNMHYTLLNFSLMQSSGNMQGIKGKCDKDRLDAFLVYLNEFFKISDIEIQRTKLKEIERNYGTDENINALNDYLNTFRISKDNNNDDEPTESLKNYCAKIYFLPTFGYPTGMMEVKNIVPSNLDDEKKKDWDKFFSNDPEAKSKWHNLLIRNNDLIKALIESGKEPLGSHDRVVEYMLLAVRFWQAKEKYFELMDEILETEKDK